MSRVVAIRSHALPSTAVILFTVLATFWLGTVAGIALTNRQFEPQLLQCITARNAHASDLTACMQSNTQVRGAYVSLGTETNTSLHDSSMRLTAADAKLVAMTAASGVARSDLTACRQVLVTARADSGACTSKLDAAHGDLERMRDEAKAQEALLSQCQEESRRHRWSWA